MCIHQSIGNCTFYSCNFIIKNVRLKLPFFFELMPRQFFTRRFIPRNYVFRFTCWHSCIWNCLCVECRKLKILSWVLFSHARLLSSVIIVAVVDLTVKRRNYRNCICMYLKVADVDRRHVVYVHCTASVIHTFQNANERHFPHTNAYCTHILKQEPRKTLELKHTLIVKRFRFFFNVRLKTLNSNDFSVHSDFRLFLSSAIWTGIYCFNTVQITSLHVKPLICNDISIKF